MEENYRGTRWGGYDVLYENTHEELHTKLKRLYVYPNANLSYQKHEKRAENWTVLSGSGIMIVNDEVYELRTGVSISIPVGFWHCVKAEEDGLEIAEVQVGTACEETDIERKFYNWNEIIAHVKELQNIG